MVAAFDVFLDTGGSDNSPGTSTDIDALGPPALRFKTADNPTIDTVNPVPIPSAGTNNSYWKQLYLKCSNAPDTQVNNVLFYTDGGGFGTGITMNAGDEFPVRKNGVTTGYEIATGTPGTSGDIMTDHAEITGTTDAFTFTSPGSELGPITITEDGSIINATSETTHYLVLQVVVATTASPGNKADETLTFQYDEI